MRTKVTIAAGCVSAVLMASDGFAQAPAEPRFEVASVKLGDPRDVRNVHDMSPGQYRVDNVSLLDIVAVAFGIPPERIDGAPDWVARERFSVTARMPTGAPAADRPMMIQALLRDRFKLRARVEPREQPGYELVVARSDRRVGQQLVPSAIDCVTPGASGDRSGDACQWNARPGVFAATGGTSGVLPLGPVGHARRGPHPTARHVRHVIDVGARVHRRPAGGGWCGARERWSVRVRGAAGATRVEAGGGVRAGAACDRRTSRNAGSRPSNRPTDWLEVGVSDKASRASDGTA